MTMLCVFEHRNREEREAEIGYLCGWHRGRLDILTRDIRDRWLELALIIEAGSAPKDATPKTRHTKAASPPAPVNLDVLTLRDARTSSVRTAMDQSRPSVSVPSIVASWVLLLAAERPLTATLPSSVIAQLDLLTRHHDWIAGQPWVDDYHTELTELLLAIKGALRDSDTARELGRCYLPVGDTTCGGRIQQRNGSEAARCNRCRATWTTAQELARLELALHGSRTA